MNELANMDMWQRLEHYHGVEITLYGIFFVFVGIVIIQFCMYGFNYYFTKIAAPEKSNRAKKREANSAVQAEKDALRTAEETARKAAEEAERNREIPDEDIIAIMTAVELYYRLHFDSLNSKITFVQGTDAHNAWKLGSYYGHR